LFTSVNLIFVRKVVRAHTFVWVRRTR